MNPLQKHEHQVFSRMRTAGRNLTRVPAQGITNAHVTNFSWVLPRGTKITIVPSIRFGALCFAAAVRPLFFCAIFGSVCGTMTSSCNDHCSGLSKQPPDFSRGRIDE